MMNLMEGLELDSVDTLRVASKENHTQAPYLVHLLMLSHKSLI